MVKNCESLEVIVKNIRDRIQVKEKAEADLASPSSMLYNLLKNTGKVDNWLIPHEKEYVNSNYELTWERLPETIDRTINNVFKRLAYKNKKDKSQHTGENPARDFWVEEFTTRLNNVVLQNTLTIQDSINQVVPSEQVDLAIYQQMCYQHNKIALSFLYGLNAKISHGRLDEDYNFNAVLAKKHWINKQHYAYQTDTYIVDVDSDNEKVKTCERCGCILDENVTDDPDAELCLYCEHDLCLCGLHVRKTLGKLLFDALYINKGISFGLNITDEDKRKVKWQNKNRKIKLSSSNKPDYIQAVLAMNKNDGKDQFWHELQILQEVERI